VSFPISQTASDGLAPSRLLGGVKEITDPNLARHPASQPVHPGSSS